MQRSNSGGISFLRRQSTGAPPTTPYGNPAPTQFLRLGVGIDHADVDQSEDEEDKEQDQEQEEEEDEDDDDDEEQEDDDERVEVEEDINNKLQAGESAHPRNDDTVGAIPPSVAQHAQPDGHAQGGQDAALPAAPLAQGLPLYHEKFTQASIHGASPLANTNNTITASKPTPLGRNQHPSVSGPSSIQPNPALPTATSTTANPAPQARHFAEKVGFINIHNWKIHYKVCYPTHDPSYRINGNGRNIILFHGALSNLESWRKVQQTLADRTGCRVLSYDRIGHGLSEKPAKWPKNANPYKNGGVMAICQTLLETLGMGQNVILIGNGAGATVASALALSKPSAVRGLILIAPSILDETPPLYLRACVSYPPPLTWIYRGLYGDHGPLQQFYYKSDTIMADPSTKAMYMRPAKDEGFWRGLSNATKFRSSFRVRHHLDRLTDFATLVMTGDVDDIVPTIETLRFFETLQSVRQPNVPQVLKIIKHAGHLPQEEKPAEFCKVISFFIKKVCLGSLSRERSLNRRVSGVARSASKKSTKTHISITDANTLDNSLVNTGPRTGPPRRVEAPPLTNAPTIAIKA